MSDKNGICYGKCHFFNASGSARKTIFKKTEQVLDKAEGEYYNLTVLTHIVHEVQMCAVRESFVQHQNQERGVLQ